MHVLTLRAQPHPRGYMVELISLRNGSPRANLNACSGCLPREVVYHACTKQSSTWRVAALFLNKVIALNGTYTEYKTIFMEKKVVRSTIYNGACLPGLSLFRVSHTRLRWPLSLSALVSDPAASRPSAEREDVHRLSVRWRWGSTSRSAVPAVLSDQAPARQGLRHLLADSARRRSPSYIPTTSRYPLRPCSTARLPTSLHVDLP